MLLNLDQNQVIPEFDCKIYITPLKTLGILQWTIAMKILTRQIGTLVMSIGGYFKDSGGFGGLEHPSFHFHQIVLRMMHGDVVREVGVWGMAEKHPEDGGKYHHLAGR